MFGKLQLRKGARQNKERGGEEKEKRKGIKTEQENKKRRRGRTERYIKEDRKENKAAFIGVGLLLRLFLVNYNRERNQYISGKEVERKRKREKR